MQPVSFAAVRHVLFYEWDPIGISENAKLSDEYDRYIPDFVRLVNGGGTVEEISQHLAEVERLLFVATTPQRKIDVAESLHRLRSGH
jgi:hypothetical protein